MATYYLVSECITNVAKYARASTTRVAVSEKDGRVVESGRHNKLLAAGGAYARLVAAQQITDPEAAVFAGGDS